MPGYKVRRDKLPLKCRFNNGRMGAAVAYHGGLVEICYHGAQRLGARRFFEADVASSWTKMCRLCVVLDGRAWFVPPTNVTLYPFGFSCRAEIGDFKFRYRLVLLPDAIVQEVVPAEECEETTYALRLLWQENVTRVNVPGREWRDFERDPETGTLTAGASDEGATTATDAERGGESGGVDCAEPAATTWFAIGAETELSCHTAHGGWKHFVDTPPAPGSQAVFLLCGHDRDAFQQRLAELHRDVTAEVSATLREYRDSIAAGVGFEERPEIACQMLDNVAPTLKSLAVDDVPGGWCASACGYWIWGWDTLVYSESYLLAGQTDFVRDMLAYYRRVAHEEYGIPHQVTRDHVCRMRMAWNAQCLYLVALYHYTAFTGDLEPLREHWDFANWILGKCRERVVGDTGLLEGMSLFPDFPHYLGEDGHDLSAFNNSIYYQALRAMECLALLLDDHAAATERRREAAACAAGFDRCFWDDDRGYYVDSVAADTLDPRRHYPVFAVLWVTPFARELVAAHIAELAAFMPRHFRFDQGLYMVPPWDSAYMGDGNQIGSYMPVTDVFYYQVMRHGRRADELAHWEQDVLPYYWAGHCYPEGLTMDVANAGITHDNPGGKQGFTAKAWHTVAVTALAGVEVDHHGITVNPPDIGGITLRGLPVRGKRVNVEIDGEGPFVVEVRLNGRAYPGAAKVPLADLEDGVNELYVHLAWESDGLRICRADGFGVQTRITGLEQLRGTLTGGIAGEVVVTAPMRPVVRLDGREVEVTWDEATETATFHAAPAAPGQDITLEIDPEE